MLTVWFIELIIVGQFMLNRFYVDLVKLYKRAEELEEKNSTSPVYGATKPTESAFFYLTV